MRRHSLLSRLLVPILIVLIMLPPLSCFVFQKAAGQYAYDEASDNLENLQKNVLPLMEKRFEREAHTADAVTEQIQSFLQQVGFMAHRTGGRASLMIMGPEYQLVYPREESEREITAPLAEEIAKSIQSGYLFSGTKATEWVNSSGETFLVRVHEIPTKSERIQYLITYCSISAISNWINKTSLYVLIISAAFVAVSILVLWITARSVSKPLKHLCEETEKIGRGDFSEITPAFSLWELEQLRNQMNEMAKQLQKSDQVQKDFFQNVSHELRNPLMSITGYAQGIEQGVFTEPKAAAHTIMEESARLTQLVNSLLTLSRMDSGKQVPTLSSIPLGNAIEDCIDRFHGLAIQKNIVLHVSLAEPNLAVLGDEELVGQILDNLLSNAIRYSKTTVTVTAKTEAKSVLISVQDDGDGISPQDLSHIFERCYKGKGGNFGLGLSLAQAATQAMNGSLTASNSTTGGAVFTLILPLA